MTSTRSKPGIDVASLFRVKRSGRSAPRYATLLLVMLLLCACGTSAAPRADDPQPSPDLPWTCTTMSQTVIDSDGSGDLPDSPEDAVLASQDAHQVPPGTAQVEPDRDSGVLRFRIVKQGKVLVATGSVVRRDTGWAVEGYSRCQA